MAGYRGAVLATGPVAYWRLGEKSGTVAADELGANPGAYTAAPTLGAPGALNGDPDTAMAVTIAGQNYMSVPTSAALTPAQIALAGWVRTSQKTNYSYIGRKYGSAGYALRIDAGTGIAAFFCNISGTLRGITGAVDLSDGRSHFVGGTYDGATLRLYVDSVQVASLAAAGAITNDASALYCGAYQPGSEWSTCTVDEVALWNRALSAAEVAQLYTAGIAAAAIVEYIVTIRQPEPPHAMIAQFDNIGLSYGLSLMRPGTADFRISRSAADIASLPSPRVGLFATIERSDGLLPFAGFVTHYSAARGDPEGQFVVTDHTWLLTQAITQKGGTFSGNTGTLIAQTLREINDRGQPPIDLRLRRIGSGTAIDYTYAAAKADAFLKSVSDFSGWEWALAYDVSSSEVVASLVWAEQLGADVSGAVVWEEGLHLQDVTYTQDAAGYLAAAVAIGGTGTVADRPAAAVSASGTSAAGIPALAASVRSGASPALQGTRVIIDQQVSASDALFAAARRLTDAPENVGESLSFKVVEREIDMSKLAVGNIVSVRLAETDMGTPIERKVRILGLKVDGASGVHEVESQVLAA